MWRSIVLGVILAFVANYACADQKCRRNYVAGESGLEVNGTPCDHGPLPGVRAICRDGSQSFHIGRGTCSHHGGIARHVN